MPENAETRLAQHAATLAFERLPASAVNCAKVFITDTLSVGVAGSRVPEVQPLMSALGQSGDPSGRQSSGHFGGQPPVGLWGHGRQADPAQAILVNAYQVHCQEFDCLHEGAVLHAMATLLPVLVAQVQVSSALSMPTSGRAFIAAVAAGVDVACTLGLSANRGLRFFRPATSGGFGAVAALANLRGFSPEQTLSALGHQLAQTSGTMQGHTEGSVILPLQVGLNARAAWLSCALTEAGFPSLQQPITGKFGYLPLFEGDFEIEALLDELGVRWRVQELSHKPFASGRACHGGVEGLMALRAEHGFDAEDLVAVTVKGPLLINHLVNRPPLAQPSANYARLCMPYVLAKVLQHGEIDPTHYDVQALNDKRTFELAQKVKMVTDDNPDPNAFVPQTVTVELRDGTTLTKRLEQVLASPSRRLDKAARDRKFKRCWSLSATDMGCPQAMLDGLERFDELEDVGPLLGFCVAG